jgi:hypothetical protein
MDTKPPIFREADEPLHADEWLNTIEQKFSLLRVTKGMKASLLGTSCRELQVSGGIIIRIPSLLMLRSFGTSSKLLSGVTTFLLVLWKSSILSLFS